MDAKAIVLYRSDLLQIIHDALEGIIQISTFVTHVHLNRNAEWCSDRFVPVVLKSEYPFIIFDIFGLIQPVSTYSVLVAFCGY